MRAPTTADMKHAVQDYIDDLRAKAERMRKGNYPASARQLNERAGMIKSMLLNDPEFCEMVAAKLVKHLAPETVGE